MNRVEECMGLDPEILRGRMLARLRISEMRRSNRTWRPKPRVFMLDFAGLACLLIAFKILDAPRGFDVVAVASCLVSALYRDFWQGTFGMFDLVLGDNLVDSWNPKVGWTFVRNLMVVLTSKGTFSVFHYQNLGASSNASSTCRWEDLEMLLGPGGHFWCLEAALDPEVVFRTCKINIEPGPYSASLEETTTGTSSDFAFYRSKAGHYRVPMLNAASEEATIRLLEMCWLWRFNTGTCAYEFWEPRYALGYTWVLGSFDNILSTLRKCLKSFSVYLVLWTEARFGAGVRTSSCGNLKTGVLPGESEDLGLAWQQE
ncbi:hypothetical protein F2Q70_00029763 [Brassica cretica]|uniref:Uncharacterized protein n=1 Tax=Brassica cretica TaxID=69181 RepID=A0A8S9FPQ7_BRACR|nr:hypothetical protein F2Q70_00029763 [Brassica cretica]